MDWGGHPSELGDSKSQTASMTTTTTTAGATTSAPTVHNMHHRQLPSSQHALGFGTSSIAEAGGGGSGSGGAKFHWPFSSAGGGAKGEAGTNCNDIRQQRQQQQQQPSLSQEEMPDSNFDGGAMDWNSDVDDDIGPGVSEGLSPPSMTRDRHSSAPLAPAPVFGSDIKRGGDLPQRIAPHAASLLPQAPVQLRQKPSQQPSSSLFCPSKFMPTPMQQRHYQQQQHHQHQQYEQQQGQRQEQQLPQQQQQQSLQQQFCRPSGASHLQNPQQHHQQAGYHQHTPILPRYDVAILPKPLPLSPVMLIPQPVVKQELLQVAQMGGSGSGGSVGGNCTDSMVGGGSSAKRGVSATQSCASTDGGTQDEDGMTEERKKRLRNEREQRRAHLITDQIDSLKGVLENSNFPLRSTSKFDILAACDEYIQHLRQRKNCLDQEHKIGGSSSGGGGSGNNSVRSGGSGGGGGGGGPSSSSVSSASEDGESMSSGGGGRGMSAAGAAHREIVLDFSEIFRSSHVPMAVVSIDGRILQCNDEFSRVTGYTNNKLTGVTLFSLAAPECLEELFKSIARLLSTAALDENNPAYFATAAARAAPLSQRGYQHANILLSLVRDEERRARAFHCCIVAPHQNHDGQRATEAEAAADSAMS